MFNPRRVLFEEKALDYPLGRELYSYFRSQAGKEVRLVGSHNRVAGLPGETPAQKFREAKQTLVVGVRRVRNFASCRPSADFQLGLSTSCPGMCEYCYLHTTLGRQPVVRLYVNIKEILGEAGKLIEERKPQITTFEGSATSDPLPLEPLSGALAQAILFFAGHEYGRFRFVTKFTGVGPLLGLAHQGRTDFRFSVNTPEIIQRFEHHTPSLASRLAAAARVAHAGYPLGFLIAPVFFFAGWEKAYKGMLAAMARSLPAGAKPSFEVITHRFTGRGRDNILTVFPGSSLPLDIEGRRFKFGQFGYGKYLYSMEKIKAAEDFFRRELAGFFPGSNLLYFV